MRLMQSTTENSGCRVETRLATNHTLMMGHFAMQHCTAKGFSKATTHHHMHPLCCMLGKCFTTDACTSAASVCAVSLLTANNQRETQELPQPMIRSCNAIHAPGFCRIQPCDHCNNYHTAGHASIPCATSWITNTNEPYHDCQTVQLPALGRTHE